VKEEWVRLCGITEYGESYEVSNKGQIRNIKTGRILKQYLKKGYLQTVLYKNSRRRDFLSHRLVAMAFIPCENTKLHINHIDGNKENNASNNLEWVTPRQNILHAIDTGLICMKKHKELMHKTHAKPVVMIDKLGNIVGQFSSIQKASDSTGVRHDTISLQCNFKRNARKFEYSFRFMSDFEGRV
jgi:hypothetical protein